MSQSSSASLKQAATEDNYDPSEYSSNVETTFPWTVTKLMEYLRRDFESKMQKATTISVFFASEAAIMFKSFNNDTIAFRAICILIENCRASSAKDKLFVVDMDQFKKENKDYGVQVTLSKTRQLIQSSSINVLLIDVNKKTTIAKDGKQIEYYPSTIISRDKQQPKLIARLQDIYEDEDEAYELKKSSEVSHLKELNLEIPDLELDV